MLGKNLESFTFLNPTEASAEPGWGPDVKNHHPQEPRHNTLSGALNLQGNLPQAQNLLSSVVCCHPKLCGLRPPRLCPKSSPGEVPCSMLSPIKGAVCADFPQGGHHGQGSLGPAQSPLSQRGSKSERRLGPTTVPFLPKQGTVIPFPLPQWAKLKMGKATPSLGEGGRRVRHESKQAR